MSNGKIFAWSLCFALGALTGKAAASESDASRTLHLRAGTVDTRQATNLLKTTGTTGRLPSGSDAHHVLQITGALTPARRQALSHVGVELGQYLPDHAYLVDLSKTDRNALAALDFVAWLGTYQNAWKIDPDVGRRIAPFQTQTRLELEAAGKLQLTVTLFEGVTLEKATEKLAALGAEILAADHVGEQGVVCIAIVAGDLSKLAGESYVQFVEESSEVTFRNSSDRWIVQSNILNVTPLYDNGLHGEGQIIGILDGKIDRNHCSFIDSNPIGPTHRKIEAYNTSAGTDTHGTHVAGTGVGDSGVDDNTRGVAYMARLVFNDIPSFSDTAIYSVLQTHHNQGARVHTNSWGNDGTTSYDGLARGFDRFQYDFEESLCCLAVTNGASLKNPENAKNLLACGASQDAPNQSNHCSGGVGPTADGRRKPEIYAPGCGTTSSASNTTCGTTSLTGTSMASPAIAGAGLLVRQYYTDGYYPSGAPVIGDTFTPSGALVKATLLNSAVDMTGISGYPSNLEGWGRVLADNALYFSGETRTLLVDQRWNVNGLSTGENVSIDFTVTSSGEPLTITMVFTDPPATAGASNPVVNNLDLVATAPDGTTTYKGNVFAGGQSTTGGLADLINNVEQVRLTTPSTGQWSVSVGGTAVNQGTQGYALVITGAVALGPAPPQTNDVAVNLPINTSTTVQLVGQDIDEDPLDFIITTLPAHGTLSDPGAGTINVAPYTLLAGGDQVGYQADTNYAGSDAFNYKANDGNTPPDGGDSNVSTVGLLIIADLPQITTAALPDGIAGQPYAPFALQMTGGQPPVAWELVTDLPYLETDLGTSGFAEVGLAQSWNGDDQFDNYTLPFPFPFYDGMYTTVRVWSNGFLNFGAHTGSSYSNSDQGLIDNVRIAPLWDDLRTDQGASDIFIDESTTGQVTIRWKATTYNGSYPCDFSVTLHDDGAIDFHYGLTNEPISATVGISSGDGARFTLASVNPATSLLGVSSIRFAQPDPLSPGLSIDSAGVLSGTPLVAGDFLPVFRVTDSLSRTDEAVIPLHIAAAPGDFDGDGDVDLVDFASLADCLSGPGMSPPPAIATPCLDAFDFDGDSDVDLADYETFARIVMP